MHLARAHADDLRHAARPGEELTASAGRTPPGLFSWPTAPYASNRRLTYQAICSSWYSSMRIASYSVMRSGEGSGT